jgi:hypothetical protein
MNTKGRVVIAEEIKHSNLLEELRWKSYHNSESFVVVNEDVFKKHCKWSKQDLTGLVLLALDNDGNALATMRGNIFYNEGDIESDMNFKDNNFGFINYPALNMTFAATSPTVFKSGLNSVLRYYFYCLHKHAVKSILGTGIVNSSIHKTLTKLNYVFKLIDDPRQDLLGNDKKFIAKLEQSNFTDAIAQVYEKYKDVIHDYPLVIG